MNFRLLTAVPVFPAAFVLALSALPGCASASALGIPNVAVASPDPRPMCVALRGGISPDTSTTEVTAAVEAVHPTAASRRTASAKKPSETSTVKDQRALVVAKGT